MASTIRDLIIVRVMFGNFTFCFPFKLNVSSISSRQTLRFSGKQNYFPREKTMHI